MFLVIKDTYKIFFIVYIVNLFKLAYSNIIEYNKNNSEILPQNIGSLYKTKDSLYKSKIFKENKSRFLENIVTKDSFVTDNYNLDIPLDNTQKTVNFGKILFEQTDLVFDNNNFDSNNMIDNNIISNNNEGAFNFNNIVDNYNSTPETKNFVKPISQNNEASFNFDNLINNYDQTQESNINSNTNPFIQNNEGSFNFNNLVNNYDQTQETNNLSNNLSNTNNLENDNLSNSFNQNNEGSFNFNNLVNNYEQTQESNINSNTNPFIQNNEGSFNFNNLVNNYDQTQETNNNVDTISQNNEGSFNFDNILNNFNQSLQNNNNINNMNNMNNNFTNETYNNSTNNFTENINKNHNLSNNTNNTNNNLNEINKYSLKYYKKYEQNILITSDNPVYHHCWSTKLNEKCNYMLGYFNGFNKEIYQSNICNTYFSINPVTNLCQPNKFSNIVFIIRSISLNTINYIDKKFKQNHLIIKHYEQDIIEIFNELSKANKDIDKLSLFSELINVPINYNILAKNFIEKIILNIFSTSTSIINDFNNVYIRLFRIKELGKNSDNSIKMNQYIGSLIKYENNLILEFLTLLLDIIRYKEKDFYFRASNNYIELMLLYMENYLNISNYPYKYSFNKVLVDYCSNNYSYNIVNYCKYEYCQYKIYNECVTNKGLIKSCVNDFLLNTTKTNECLHINSLDNNNQIPAQNDFNNNNIFSNTFENNNNNNNNNSPNINFDSIPFLTSSPESTSNIIQEQKPVFDSFIKTEEAPLLDNFLIDNNSPPYLTTNSDNYVKTLSNNEFEINNANKDIPLIDFSDPETTTSSLINFTTEDGENLYNKNNNFNLYLDDSNIEQQPFLINNQESNMLKQPSPFLVNEKELENNFKLDLDLMPNTDNNLNRFMQFIDNNNNNNNEILNKNSLNIYNILELNLGNSIESKIFGSVITKMHLALANLKENINKNIENNLNNDINNKSSFSISIQKEALELVISNIKNFNNTNFMPYSIINYFSNYTNEDKNILNEIQYEIDDFYLETNDKCLFNEYKIINYINLEIKESLINNSNIASKIVLYVACFNNYKVLFSYIKKSNDSKLDERTSFNIIDFTLLNNTTNNNSSYINNNTDSYISLFNILDQDSKLPVMYNLAETKLNHINKCLKNNSSYKEDNCYNINPYLKFNNTKVIIDDIDYILKEQNIRYKSHQAYFKAKLKNNLHSKLSTVIQDAYERLKHSDRYFPQVMCLPNSNEKIDKMLKCMFNEVEENSFINNEDNPCYFCGGHFEEIKLNTFKRNLQENAFMNTNANTNHNFTLNDIIIYEDKDINIGGASSTTSASVEDIYNIFNKITIEEINREVIIEDMTQPEEDYILPKQTINSSTSNQGNNSNNNNYYFFNSNLNNPNTFSNNNNNNNNYYMKDFKSIGKLKELELNDNQPDNPDAEKYVLTSLQFEDLIPTVKLIKPEIYIENLNSYNNKLAMCYYVVIIYLLNIVLI